MYYLTQYNYSITLRISIFANIGLCEQNKREPTVHFAT